MEKYWNLESKHKKSKELAEKRQLLLRKLEKDWIRYKTLSEERTNENETLKAEVAKLTADLLSKREP